jgi:hypothetical protein
LGPRADAGEVNALTDEQMDDYVAYLEAKGKVQ